MASYKNKGFALVQLMIVLTFLATVALIEARGRVSTKRLEAAEAFAEELNWTLEAIRRFYVMNGRFPNDLAELQPNFIPAGHPQDPFGGAIRVDVANDPALPIRRQHFNIIINGGIAATDYANIIVNRVPNALKIGNTLVLPVEGPWVWIDKDIVYTGIHRNGDVIHRFPCPGGLENRSYAVPVAIRSTDGGSIMGYRTGLEPIGDNFLVICRPLGEFDPDEQDDCHAWIIQFCE